MQSDAHINTIEPQLKAADFLVGVKYQSVLQVYTFPMLGTPEYALMMSFPDWGGGSSSVLTTRGANDNPLTGSIRFSVVLKN